MSSARRRLVLVLTASALMLAGYVLLLSFNAAGVILIGAGLVLLVWAARERWLSVAALLVAGGCAFATWATLDGGAESWTALPWLFVAIGAVGVAGWSWTRPPTRGPDS